MLYTNLMIINIHNLKLVSGDETSKIKFVLFEDGTLLFGKCKWHIDLVETFKNIDSNLNVLGAGVVPKDIEEVGLENEYWGNWESTGYKVVTSDSLRSVIREALLPFSSEINNLYK